MKLIEHGNLKAMTPYRFTTKLFGVDVLSTTERSLVSWQAQVVGQLQEGDIFFPLENTYTKTSSGVFLHLIGATKEIVGYCHVSSLLEYELEEVVSDGGE